MGRAGSARARSMEGQRPFTSSFKGRQSTQEMVPLARADPRCAC
ncbi:hypothetical protein DB31_6064 [Hyalangium minutum]|uniref:Uncharacterized protein n=1 Tax=Hyalangium minutum TaxID=394096 RepID=A0A085VWH8_9BACT|nr:hypothetical protein DB31_6064 [Hyalangium minutum]